MSENPDIKHIKASDLAADEADAQADQAAQAAKRRRRSLAIGISLALMAIAFYAASIARLGGRIAERQF